MGETLKKFRPVSTMHFARLVAVCAALVAAQFSANAAEETIPPPAEATQPPAQPAEDAPAQPPDPEEARRTAYVHFCVAMSLIREGDNDAALDELRNVVELDPDAPQAWFHLGSIYRSRREHHKAAECLTKAVALDPDKFRYRYELGRVLMHAGKVEEALKHWWLAGEATEGKTAAFIYQRIARHYRGGDDTDKAMEALKRALETGEAPMRAARQLVRLQQQHHKWLDAAQTYSYMLSLRPEAAALHLKIAKCYEKLTHWAKALAEYDAYFAAAKLTFEDYPALERAIAAARNAGLEQEAEEYVQRSIQALSTALEKGAADPTRYARFTLLLGREGHLQQAVSTLTKALENAADADAVEIHKALADGYLQEALPRKAEAEIIAALKLDPQNAALRAKLSSFCVDMLRFEEAAEALVKAVELTDDRTRIAYRVTLAEIYAEIEEYAKAEEQLDIILKENPDSAAAWAGLGQIRKYAGKLEKAADALKEAIKQGAPDPMVNARWRLYLADVHADLKQNEQEQQQYAEIQKLAEQSPTDAIRIAYVLYDHKRYERGVALVKAAQDKAGADAPSAAQSLLMMFYRKLGKADLAEKELRRMVENDPENSRLHRDMAKFLEEHERYDEAFKALDAALEWASGEEEPLTHLARADLLDNLGRADEAEKVYEQVLKKHGDKPVVNNNVSYFYAVKDRELDTALALVRKALRDEPQSPAYLDTLGWVLYRMGKLDGALLKIHQAFQRQKDAVIAEHLGDVLLKLGRKEQALKYYKKAIELDPDAEEPAKKMEELTKAIQATHAE